MADPVGLAPKLTRPNSGNQLEGQPGKNEVILGRENLNTLPKGEAGPIHIYSSTVEEFVARGL